MEAILGIAPMAWSNADLLELAGDTALETRLKESREAEVGPEPNSPF